MDVLQVVHHVQVDVDQVVPAVVVLHVKIHVVETALMDVLVDALDVHLTVLDHVGLHVAVDVVETVQVDVMVAVMEVVLDVLEAVQVDVLEAVVVDALETVHYVVNVHHIAHAMGIVLHVLIAVGNVVMALDTAKEV